LYALEILDPSLKSSISEFVSNNVELGVSVIWNNEISDKLDMHSYLTFSEDEQLWQSEGERSEP